MYLEKNSGIVFLRVLGVILILACHLVQENSNSYIQMTAQFLNVGVSIFIIISGYLYGSKENIEGYILWVIKRLKRILIPLYVFMVYLLVVYLIKNISIDYLNWIVYIFNFQGLQIYVHGAEHLWYLTIIMFCYLITPILNKIKYKFTRNNLMIFILVFILGQVVATYFISTQIGIYLTYVFLYIIAYIIGYKNINISNNKVFMSMIIIIISILVRLTGKVLFNNSILYNVLIVGYTQGVIAFTIFYLFVNLGKYIKPSKFIKYIDYISFEIYLVHYMYMVGPLRLMGITNSFVLNSAITIIVSIISAIVLNKIINFIYIVMRKEYKFRNVKL